MKLPTSRDIQRNPAQRDPDARATPRKPPGAPEILERGYGDEHGGYLVDPEADRAGLPPKDPVPGARS